MNNHPEIPSFTTKEDFGAWSANFRESSGWREPIAFALGSPIYTKSGTLASVRFPLVNGPTKNLGTASVYMHYFGIKPEGVQIIWPTTEELWDIKKYFTVFHGDGQVHDNIELLEAAANYKNSANHLTNTDGPVCLIFIFDDEAVVGVPDATLKLYLMSLRHFKPNSLNLNGIFGALPNIIWIGGVPYDKDGFDTLLLDAAFSGSGRNHTISTDLVDKFPFYSDHINALKMGVRICDPHKVRLGAYLGEGTTVMPGASYINFNAGTEGKAMVEGRISSSAFIGDGSDVGGGASILGTLSGGNSTPIKIGKKCLLGANSTLGICLGDAVTLAAGVSLMPQTDVYVEVSDRPDTGQPVKALTLSGVSAVTFVPHPHYGVRMIRTPKNTEAASDAGIILNEALHANT